MKTFYSALLILFVSSALAVGPWFPVRRVQQRVYPTPVAGPSSLNTDLISYWKHDEASGNRVDSEPTGTAQDLTDNGSIVSGTGKINNGSDLEASSSQWFSRADSADLSLGADQAFSIALWVKFETVGGSTPIVNKLVGLDGNSDEYNLDLNGSSNFRFYVGYGAGIGQVIDTTIGVPSTGVWYFVVVWHDPVADQVGMSINNGTPDVTSHSLGTQDTAGSFQIGNYSSLFLDAVVDEVAFYKKVLSAAEITELFNSNVGKTCCPF